jgi:hypothetical protein
MVYCIYSHLPPAPRRRHRQPPSHQSAPLVPEENMLQGVLDDDGVCVWGTR